MKGAALSFFLLIASLSEAKGPLSIIQERVCVVSSFEEKDFFTVYSSEGVPLWEVSFSSKILSRKIDNGHLYIFSRERAGKVYFLSCFEMEKGQLLWERPIFAPEPPEPAPP